jgi:multidrug efflux system outer membrane protein
MPATALPAVPVPDAWSAPPPAERESRPSAPSPAAKPDAEAGSRLAAWWQGFGDARLTALIEQAAGANTDVRGAEAALRQARALRDQSAAGLAPTLGASASTQRSQVGRNPSTRQYDAGFDASWEPDVFGGTRASVAASEADAAASATSLGDVQISIAAEVALAYVELRGNQARLAIAGSNLASQEETLQLTQWRRQAGLASSLDVEQARTSAEQTRAQGPALRTAVSQAASSLAVLTGQTPQALHDALVAEPGRIPQAAGTLAMALPAETLRQRPDVRTAEHQVEAAWSRVGQAQAQRLPSFSLSGSLGLSALSLGSLASSGAVVGALLGGVSLPLFDGGARRAAVRAQEAALEQQQATYRATVLTALKEVEDALVALRNTREQLAMLQRAAEAAGNAALLARQRYGSGLIDFQTVLDTQRTLLSAEDGVASAQADDSSNHVRLYKALGGGWQPPSEPARTAATPSASPLPPPAPSTPSPARS